MKATATVKVKRDSFKVGATVFEEDILSRVYLVDSIDQVKVEEQVKTKIDAENLSGRQGEFHFVEIVSIVEEKINK